MRIDGISFYRNEKDELCALAQGEDGKEYILINLYPDSIEESLSFIPDNKNYITVTFSYDFDR